MERDYKYIFREFDKYVRILEAEGIYPPSINSIEFFCKEMITKKYWYYPPTRGGIKSVMIYGSLVRDQISTEPILDRSDGVENRELFNEMRDKLIERVNEMYGETGNEERARKWAPNPFSVDDRAFEYALSEGMNADVWDKMEPLERKQSVAYQKAVADSIYVKNQCNNYFETVGAFMLRKTMHHPIMSIYFSFSASASEGRNSTFLARAKGGEVTVDSEEDIKTFMEQSEYKDILSMGNDSFRGIWFVPSTTGDNIKMACIDFDNPNMSAKTTKMKTAVRNVSKKLEAAEVPYIIMFTGKSYQIWFGTEAIGIDNQYEANRYIDQLTKGVDVVVSAKSSVSTAERQEAIERGVPLIDKSVNTKNKPLGMFFGMHYKPQKTPTDDPGTGYVRVPVPIKQLTAFDATQEAHPQFVLKNFNSLSLQVDQFFDEVKMGQGYGGKGNIETPPACFRSDENEPDFSTVKFAEEWKKGKRGFPEYNFSDGRAEASQYSELIVTPKFDGWLGAIHYRSTGNFVLNGKRLVEQKERSTRTGNILSSEEVQCVLVTRGGIIMWDNHLTREFQRTCERLGIREAILVGEIVTYNEFGKVAGPQGVTAVLNRKEKEDGATTQNERLFNNLRFTLTDLIKIDGKQWGIDDSYEAKHDLLKQFTSFRIDLTPYFRLQSPFTERFDALWSQVTVTDGHEGFVVYADGNRFKVKRQNTLDAVIIGIDSTSKRWIDGKGIGSAYVAVVHNRPKFGPIYVSLGRVGTTGLTDAQRLELTEKVVGTENENVVPLSKALGQTEETMGLEDVILVEPTTVVEIVYEKLNEGREPSFAMYRQQRMGKGRGARTNFAFADIMYSRRMRSPRIVGIREDKNPLKKLDVDSAQGDTSGGFQIGAKPNPVFGIPSLSKLAKELNRIQFFYPTAEKGPPVIMDDNELVQRSFVGNVIAGPEVLDGPIDMWRKLHKLMDRDREFAGYVKNNTIYYGTSHNKMSVAVGFNGSDWANGVDFMFHTHPANPRFGNSLGYMSPEDVVASMGERVLFGVRYQVISENYGFDVLRIDIKKDSPLAKEMKKLTKSKTEAVQKKAIDEIAKILKAESKLVVKQFRNKTADRNKFQSYLLKSEIAFTPFDISAITIEGFNKVSKNFHIQYQVMPLPLYQVSFNGQYPQLEILNNPMSFYGFEPTRHVELVGYPGEEVYGLDIRKEFQNAYDRAYAFDKPPGDQKMYLTGTSSGPQSPAPIKVRGRSIYLDVSNLDQGTFASAIDDDLMEGQDAAKILPKHQSGIEVPASMYDMERDMYHNDGEQNRRDAKVQMRVFFDMAKPKTSLKSEDPDKYYEEWFEQIDESTEVLKKVSTKKSLPKDEKKVLAEVLKDEIIDNPQHITNSWNDEIEKFIITYDAVLLEYTNGVSGHPDLVLQTIYPEWEFKALQKARLLSLAENEYSYTDEEISAIQSGYQPKTLSPSLKSAFSDLYGPGLRFDDVDDEEGDFDGTEPEND